MNILNTVRRPQFWRTIKHLLGGQRSHRKPITTPQALADFLHSRAAYIAQTTLYGYIKTRAGTRFPLLFEDSGMLASINIAKWQVWAACLSDLSVYVGLELCRQTDAPTTQVRTLLGEAVTYILSREGTPAEAGPDFAATVAQIKQRIAHADFAQPQDDDAVFCKSPAALVHWAPIADELKTLDVEIVRNSVRFRWGGVLEQLQTQLRADLLLNATENTEPVNWFERVPASRG